MQGVKQKPATLYVDDGEVGLPGDSIVKRVFLTPTVALLLLFSIFPLVWSLGISFTDMQRGAAGQAPTAATEEGDAAVEEEAVGIFGSGLSITGRNYARMPTDERLLTAAFNTMFYVIGGVLLQFMLGMLLAVVLNQDFLGRNIIRVLFLTPMMVTPVAVAYTGRMMFDSFRSPLAQLLRQISGVIGLESALVAPWLTEGEWARATILLIDTWQWTPFMMLILLAGMQSIPDDIYEAARVDGASALQIFWRITFPILLPISLTVILIRGLEIFKIIDIIVVTTGGGPGSATESLTMYIYKTAISFGNFGYAAAISYVLLVLVVIFATLFLFVGRAFTRRSSVA